MLHTMADIQRSANANHHEIPPISGRKLLAKQIKESLASVGAMTWSWRSLFRYPQKKQLAMAVTTDRHLLAGGRMGVNQHPGQTQESPQSF